MEYFTNIVRATRSALRSAHTEFQREMYTSTPSNTTLSSNNTPVQQTPVQQTPVQQEAHNTSQAPSNENNISTHTIPTITTAELSHLRKAIYNNTISTRK